MEKKKINASLYDSVSSADAPSRYSDFLIPWDNLTMVKTIAILSVILVHIPNMCRPVLVLLNFGVPLFLMVQAYIVFAKLESGERSVASYYSMASARKIFKRIVLPWMILVAVENIVGLRSEGHLSLLLNLGASGPGSYYLFVYICFYLLIPVLWKCIWVLPVGAVLCIGALISILLDYGFPWLIDYAPATWRAGLYRFSPTKFFMLAPLAYAIFKADFARMKNKILFAVLGALSFALLSFHLFYPEFTFSRDYGWTTAHWWAYFYPAMIMVFLLLSNRRLAGGGASLARESYMVCIPRADAFVLAVWQNYVCR